jgi:hypothetical protein
MQRHNSAQLESASRKVDVQEKMAGNQNLRMKKPMDGHRGVQIPERKIESESIICLQEISSNIKRERNNLKN